MVPCADGSLGRDGKPLRWNAGQTVPPGQEGACVRSRKKPPGSSERGSDGKFDCSSQVPLLEILKLQEATEKL